MSEVAKTKPPKIKLGWFSFSCCEDSTIVMTELMNDHWREWKELFDFRNVHVMKKDKLMDEFDVSFVEGAIVSDAQKEKLIDIRAKSKILVAIGACAVVGMPSGQRNNFTPGQMQEIQFLIDRFKALPKVLNVADVVKVDAQVPGCPMDPKIFLTTVEAAVKQLRGATA